MPDASSRAEPAKQRVELADVFARYGREYLSRHRTEPRHRRVMRRIVACRTAALGGHRQWCGRCGYQRAVYHSCRDRHCPKCQTQAKEAWRQSRRLELLPVPYFHQVFTLPHELNFLLLASESNQRALLALLFEAASATLLEFGRCELRGQLGFTLVLHTWDQQLRPHFHLHGLIAAGALAAGRPDSGPRWVAGGSQFLFPVRALSKMFRGKFLAGLQQLLTDKKLDFPEGFTPDGTALRQLLRRLSRKAWVVYSKAPFAGPAKLLDYLSRYTHRVAILNHRLVGCAGGKVTFCYRDRADGDRRKQARLPAHEFIGRFLTHVLPDRFVRIRHYGFLANRHKAARLAQIRQLLGASAPSPLPPTPTADQWLREVLGIDTTKCPCCGEPLLQTRLAPLPGSNVLLVCFPEVARPNPRGPPQRPT
jgi:Putative transposase/Transposase zinc-binding domain